jgi:hypothetical protein
MDRKIAKVERKIVGHCINILESSVTLAALYTTQKIQNKKKQISI